MISVNSECITMTRRCLLTFKPFRIFVAGIGFFSLCFLMTSLGGQFSAKRLADSPFSIRTEVLGGLESRGVLRKISDMLEIIMKRIDTLSKMSNSSESHRLEELSSALHSFQPVGLVERIQAIAQNVSDMAIRMEQILKKTNIPARGRDGVAGQCEVPKDPRYPDCASKVDWMRGRWTSDPCYAFYGVDGSDCSFLIYLSEVEWFCPPLAWRNQSSHPTTSSLPKRQAFFRSDLSLLLERVGSGKESLSFMRRRMRRLAAQWAAAARRLDERLRGHHREQKRILVHVGFLTEESGDVFSPKVLKGGPLGEMVQWADILTTLHVLGHNLKISLSVKELQGSLGVPPGRGSCPLIGPLPFDLIYTDYHGLQQMKQHMGLSFRQHRCHIRVIDTFGTEPAYNNEEYATVNGYRTNWGYWNLNCKQYMTMFPHTPDNSFMGFVTEELNQTERLMIQRDKVNNMAVVYGKEASMWKGKEKLLSILHRYMDIHGTVYYEAQRPPEVPAFVRNHGLLPQQELQQLLRKAKLFLGFGFPYEGPAPLEAIANGCVFLQPKFSPPHSSLNHEFFRGKPTSREVSSQHPYTEQYIGKPHVITVDFNNSQEFETAVQDGKACKETCPRQCSSLTDQRKLQLFTEFYAVSYERQQAIILSGLEQHKVSRRRPRGPDTENTKRKYTFKYHVQQGGQRLAVCKLTFMSVFQLTNSRLQVIQEKLGSQSEGTEQVVRSPLEDLRGKHKNRPHSIHPAVREGIREHILSFPRQPNHYSRMKGDVEK
ncbi:alpha-1,6-mannosylglycoprotein 6-beta-N-acetylglucosaminyltransferase B-like [Cyprinus carpio]|uniref:alpha-1,6-mannosyl-glycoprotein 6-beta-N-acetylglucosaminyltransferase n=2 Tax=Cyprinoidei TaxID=30727 RepID=A0A9Q9WUE3_CYPCA|nr:alpha-1,6-mannosylglycoprotein 6-beta-N-acetylglucosaminyltransferase B-like [Cyprinus carpio]